MKTFDIITPTEYAKDRVGLRNFNANGNMGTDSPLVELMLKNEAIYEKLHNDIQRHIDRIITRREKRNK